MYMKGTTIQTATAGEVKVGDSDLYQNAAAGTNPKSLAFHACRLAVMKADASAADRTLTVKRYDTSDPGGAATTLTWTWGSGAKYPPVDLELELDFPFGGTIQVSDATNLVVGLVYVPIRPNPAFELPETPYS